MKLKDATSVFGRVGLLTSIILIFFIAADSAYACPGNTRVVYRTRAVNSRMVPVMGTTVITYGGPGSYARCGDKVSRTQSVRYVAVRRNVYPSASRYVAVRSSGAYYPVRRTRYVAVRNVDYDDDDAPRYVAIRRQPVYADSGVRYAAVRNYVPRTRYVAVRSVDMDDDDFDYAPRYVAVRRVPVYEGGRRYLVVRNVDSDYTASPARYVAVRNVRNAFECAPVLQSSLDEVETVSPRHVVVKSDYLAGTQEVIVPETSYDDTAYLAPPVDNIRTTRYADYAPVAYAGGNGVRYIAASEIADPCSREVALRTCSGDLGTRTVSYVPTTYNDSDFDDQAILDRSGTAYIAADDIEDACLSRVAVQAPMETTTRAVSYVPVRYVDDDASLVGSGTTYIANEDAVPAVRYVAVADDDDDDADITYVAADDVADSCSCPVSFQTNESGLGAETVSYVPVNDVNMSTVSYVPVENIEDMHTVSYVPVEDSSVQNVSYVPAESVDYVDTAAAASDETPIAETSVETEPIAVAEGSAAMIDEENLDAGLSATQEVAGRIGYADGLEDGRNAALNRNENRPGDSQRFQMATNGYADTVGDMDIYQYAYRSLYLQGFSAGYDSALGSS
jgi:hypothetical protein